MPSGFFATSFQANYTFPTLDARIRTIARGNCASPDGSDREIQLVFAAKNIPMPVKKLKPRQTLYRMFPARERPNEGAGCLPRSSVAETDAATAFWLLLTAFYLPHSHRPLPADHFLSSPLSGLTRQRHINDS
jgi:hypothetical protein